MLYNIIIDICFFISSKMKVPSHPEFLCWKTQINLIRAYVAKRYFNLKATVDVQITALFLNSSPTVTYLTIVKLQSK